MSNHHKLNNSSPTNIFLWRQFNSRYKIWALLLTKFQTKVCHLMED